MIDFLKKDKELIWHPFTPQEGSLPENILVTKGEGFYLHTNDGRKIIDAISSWWVNLHGHAHPIIAEALAKQALQLEHVIFAGFTHAPAVTLAENLLSVLPSSFAKVFYSDNGSTANEVAIKMAMQYWHNQGAVKKKIIAFEGAYHGDTFGAMAVGDRSVFSAPFVDYLFDVEFLEFPSAKNQQSVYNHFQALAKSGEVGIFIFEPLLQGASGMRMYDAVFLDSLLELAKKHKIVCIADEVFTGFYRTGKFFACDYLLNKPDIIALSKGLTGGTLPLGATICTKEIYNAFVSADFSKAFLHGHSYTANPLACAAANASFDLLLKLECQKNIKRIVSLHQKFIEKITLHSNVKEARMLGTICAIEIKVDANSGYTNYLRDQILQYFLSRDILLRPLGNVMYLVPPYCMDEETLNHIYTNMESFLDLL